MTDKPTPTDAELFEVIREAARGGAVRRDGSTSLRIARAVLAKWGQPTQAAEPVAWAFKYDDGTWHDPSTTEHSSGMRPLFAAPQPVAREPLTDEQREAIWQECRYDNGGWEVDCWEVIDAVERMHSIKGGPHGTE